LFDTVNIAFFWTNKNKKSAERLINKAFQRIKIRKIFYMNPSSAIEQYHSGEMIK